MYIMNDIGKAKDMEKMQEEYYKKAKDEKDNKVAGAKKLEQKAKDYQKKRTIEQRVGSIFGTAALAFLIIFSVIFSSTQIIERVKNTKEENSFDMPTDPEFAPYDKEGSDPTETSFISTKNHGMPYSWKKSDNIVQNWFGNLYVNVWYMLRTGYNYWCLSLKKLFFPGLEDEEEGASTEAVDVEVEEEVPTASEVVHNAKDVAGQAKKLAKNKMMEMGAKKLGMNKKDLNKLKNMRKTMADGKKKVMKGGNKKVMKGGFNETVNQAISSGKELGILFALPGLFLSVIFLAIALQVIPFAYMVGAFYDNNIFVGLFMVTLGGLFFYPMMGMGYFIKIAYLLIHIFVMPTAAGNGLKLFKHYGKKYKFVWFTIWAASVIAAVYKELTPLGYPYNQAWMWTAGIFAFIIFGWWYGMFYLI